MQLRFSLPRRRVTRVVALSACGVAAAASVAAGTGVLSGAAAASPTTANKLVNATHKAILSQSAVRLTSTSRNAKTHKVVEKAIYDAGRTSSSQRYTTTSGRLTILVSPKAVWFGGNKFGLTSLFGMPSSLVAKLGSKWVAVPKSEAQYKGLASAVLSSVPGEVLPSKSATSLHIRTAKDAGAKVHVLTWTDTANGTKTAFRLDVAAKGKALPVRETKSAGGFFQVTQFGHWNEHVVVKAPKHTIDFKKLTA